MSDIQPQDIRSFLRERDTKFIQSLRSKGINLPNANLYRDRVRLLGENTLGYGNEDTEAEVCESDMTATFTITTPRKDRYGDIVVPRGCEKHIQNYMKNPQVFFAHKSTELPIAQTTNLVIEDSCIRATAKYHEETEESRVVWRFIAKGLLKATSIGFVPVLASIVEEEERELQEDELYFDGWLPLKFKEWDLLEWSNVGVPANADCTEGITKYLSDGVIEGEHIPVSIQKSLSPFTLKAKIWSPGFDLGKSKYTGVVLLGQEELEMKEGQVVRLGEVKLMEDEAPPEEVPAPVESEPTVISIENTLVPQIEKLIKENLPAPVDLTPVVTLLTELKNSFEKNLQDICNQLKSNVEQLQLQEEVQVQQALKEEEDNLKSALEGLKKAHDAMKDKYFNLTGAKI